MLDELIEMVSTVAVGCDDPMVGTERSRILDALLDDVEALAEKATVAVRAEITRYADQDDRFFDDVREHIAAHYRTKLAALGQERTLTLDDIAFVRGAAMRRARAGFALEDFLNAFRVGQHVFWQAVVAHAGETTSGHEAALSLAGPVMRYVDFASTHAGHAYAEFLQYAVADADRERRDLLEQLLVGELPTRGPLLAAADGYGLDGSTAMLVAVAVAVRTPPDDPGLNGATTALARVGRDGARTLAVARQAEIVAIPVLHGGEDGARVSDRLEAIQSRLRAEGTTMAMGVSTPAHGVGELPRAYQEARHALGSLHDEDGFAALPRLSPFQYLALHADETARRLVAPEVRTFLAEDRARGGVLTATLRTFAGADLNLRVAAEQLFVHPNTAQYRLRRLAERTGRNPRNIGDLVDLLLAIALDDRPTA